MTGYPGFGVLLTRLLDRRHLGHDELIRRSGVAERDLAAVADGETPNPSFLLRLSPALDLNAADLFAIAQVEPPDELTPLDPKAGRTIPQIVGSAARLSPKGSAELRQYVDALPRHTRERRPAVPSPVWERYSPGVGAVLVCMLKNRNLGRSTAARVLSRLAGVHLSPATIGAIGHGRKDLTIDLLVAFATVLGIQIGDLTAVAAIEETLPAQEPTMSGLIWQLRDLTMEQAGDVHQKAISLADQS
jgi:hypothetical protein